MQRQATNIKEFFAAKNSLPPWLINHAIFKSIDKVEKIFPRIGLTNCGEKIQIDQVESATNAAFELLNALSAHFGTIVDRLGSLDKANTPEILSLRSRLNILCIYMRDDKASFVQKKGNKITLTIPENIKYEDAKIAYKKGEGLFRVYNKLSEELIGLRRRNRVVPKLRSLDKMALFKAFSSVNIPSNGFSIVFSSDGIDGLWDIATMSMRGIKSCQRWNGEYKQCLIGSIVDPFTGIIYLTSGANYKQFGTKMVRRCIVRFVVDGENDKPFITIDKMYPSHDIEITTKFINFIKTKTHNKYDVVYAPELLNSEKSNKIYKPKTKIDDLIDKHSVNKTISSYQDTKFYTGKPQNKTDQRKNENHFTREANINNAIRTAINSLRITDLDVKECNFDKHLSALLRITGPDFRYQLNAYAENVSRRTIDLYNKKHKSQFETTDEHARKICHCFFANKKQIFKSENAAFIRRLNVYYKIPKDTKIKAANIKVIIDRVVSEISKTFKQQAVATFTKPIATKKVSSFDLNPYLDHNVVIAS